MIDVGRAFQTPFKDPEWPTKLGLLTVVGIVPVLNATVSGYGMAYIRSVAKGEEKLPDWSDFGHMFVKGLLWWVAAFVYALPGLVVMSIGLGVSVVPLLATLATRSSDQAAMTATIVSALVAGAAFFVIAGIYLFLVSIFAQAAYANYAMSDGFGSAFAVGEIWRKMTSKSGYFVAWIWGVLLVLAASMAASIVSGVLRVVPFLGPIANVLASTALAVAAGVMVAHLLGQYASVAYSGGASANPKSRPVPHEEQKGGTLSPMPPMPPMPEAPPMPQKPPLPPLPGEEPAAEEPPAPAAQEAAAEGATAEPITAEGEPAAEEPTASDEHPEA